MVKLKKKWEEKCSIKKKVEIVLLRRNKSVKKKSPIRFCPNISETGLDILILKAIINTS